jgi:hypothetical protein
VGYTIDGLAKRLQSTAKDPDELLRLHLSCHAFLTDSTDVPRSILCSDNAVDKWLTDCIFTDHDYVRERTYSDVSKLELHKLKRKDPEFVTEFEDLIRINFGAGKIHYERLRLTPMGTLDLYDSLKEKMPEGYTKNQLRKRNKSHAKILSEYSWFKKEWASNHKDDFLIAFERKIECIWREDWLSRANYVWSADTGKAVGATVFL